MSVWINCVHTEFQNIVFYKKNLVKHMHTNICMYVHICWYLKYMYCYYKLDKICYMKVKYVDLSFHNIFSKENVQHVSDGKPFIFVRIIPFETLYVIGRHVDMIEELLYTTRRYLVV